MDKVYCIDCIYYCNPGICAHPSNQRPTDTWFIKIVDYKEAASTLNENNDCINFKDK